MYKFEFLFNCRLKCWIGELAEFGEINFDVVFHGLLQYLLQLNGCGFRESGLDLALGIPEERMGHHWTYSIYYLRQEITDIDTYSVVPKWNALPNLVKSQETLNNFKNAYDNLQN